jgi:molybdopterin/thiamine biosynthesis adenylyltransferase/rhodanese-related sulfurtransferase
MPESPLSQDERAFYARQLRLPELGEAGQLRLREAAVLVVGAGGLGSPALLYLAAAGVGRVRICEPDALEVHNLHRQPIYAADHLGQPKGRLARQRLAALNPHIQLEWAPRALDPDHAPGLLQDMDLALDCADTQAATFALHSACRERGIPAVLAAVHGWDGQLLSVDPALPEAGCLACLWPDPPAEGPACAERGVLGPVPGLLGTLQALEALKLLLGLPGDLRRELLLVDLLSFSTRRLRRPRRLDCPVCGTDAPAAAPTASAPPADPDEWEVDPCDADLAEWRGTLVVDLREVGEPGWPLPEGHVLLNAPLSGLRFPEHGLPRDRDLLLVCAHGVRSLWVAARLRTQGHGRCWSLRGGMEGLRGHSRRS